MSMKLAPLVFLGGVLALTTAAQSATVLSNSYIDIYLDDVPAAGEIPIYMNGGEATVLWGSIGANDNTQDVRFESESVIEGSQGFATVKYTNVDKDDKSSDFATLSITTPGFQFGDLIFSPQKADIFTVSVFSVNTLLGQFEFTDMGNSVADIMVLATGAYAITRVLLEASAVPGEGFFEVKHFEISSYVPFNGGANPEPVPLPGALPLLAGGLGLVGWLARRKTRKSRVAV